MNVIFLDVDGVLNSAATRHVPLCGSASSCLKKRIDRSHVQLLDRLTRRTRSDVVFSSSWRRFVSPAEFQEILRESGFSGRVIGSTPRLRGPRGAEIAAWVHEHRPQSFVILDDRDDMRPVGRQHVRIDPAAGLTELDVAKAAQKLPPGRRIGVAVGSGMSFRQRAVNALQRFGGPWSTLLATQPPSRVPPHPPKPFAISQPNPIRVTGGSGTVQTPGQPISPPAPGGTAGVTTQTVSSGGGGAKHHHKSGGYPYYYPYYYYPYPYPYRIPLFPIPYNASYWYGGWPSGWPYGYGLSYPGWAAPWARWFV